MSLKVCMLGSGSSGNSTLIASATTGILLDAGLSARRITERLAQTGMPVGELNAICVSHEHQDHTRGLRILNRKHGIPVYANVGTVDALSRSDELSALPWTLFTTGHAFPVGDLIIEPFSVPHDAYDPVGFIVTGGGVRVGVVTDMGMATSLIRERLRCCHAVVVESNYDEKMLQEAQRPWALKQRIRGRQGHLSNQGSAQLLAEIAGPELRRVYLAHISEECNRHDIALEITRTALAKAGCQHVEVSVGYPDRISEMWESHGAARTEAETIATETVVRDCFPHVGS